MPSGVSYMLMNRKMMMRLFPKLFCARPCARSSTTCAAAADPEGSDRYRQPDRVVLLTPGRFNSAYFEHFSRAADGHRAGRRAGPVRRDDYVYMRTTSGPQRVDVMYRRSTTCSSTRLAFRPDSVLGVPGLFNAYVKGNIVICNAIGTGVADDKSIYPYVPDMIKFYLDEDPILNNVPTYQCRKASRPDSRARQHEGSGGEGSARCRRLWHAGRPGRDGKGGDFAAVVKANPLHRAAHAVALVLPNLRRIRHRAAPSTCGPSCCPGREVRMVPGGLTRVALREGSLVVNSSQGGGKGHLVLGTPGTGRGDNASVVGGQTNHVEPRCRPPLLDEPLSPSAPRTWRASSTSRSHSRCSTARLIPAAP